MRIGKPRIRIELTPAPIALNRRAAFAVVRSTACGVLALLVATIVAAADKPTAMFVGSSSCAAPACHGGWAGHKVVGSEFPLWSARDPHARAYSVLLNDVSKRMAAQLKLSNTTAHESAECLSCHSPATAAKESTNISLKPLAGVDCEQCHGAAQHWKTPHTTWKKRPADEVQELKRQLGFNDLSDVLTRAKLCADCHVGSPGRDVNHDLLAAGHPRLFFELSTFHANWPKHWPRKTDENNHPVIGTKSDDSASRGSLFEAKLWAIGQVVTAQRSLELLSRRAAHAQTWPVFAEWNCFACHHDLESPSWWQSPKKEKRPRDALAWNSWPYAMLEPLARQTHGQDSNNPISGILKLRPRFTQLMPPAKIIANDAAAAAQSLQRWAEKLNQIESESAQKLASPAALNSLLQSLIAKEGQPLAARDWDSATQVFLSINALRFAEKAARGVSNSKVEPSDRPIQAVLDSMRKTLDYQDGYRSPRQSELRELESLLSAPP